MSLDDIADHVDVIAPEQRASLLEQTGRTHQEIPLGGIHLDEDVDVRSCRRGAARDGPEQLRVGRAVPVQSTWNSSRRAARSSRRASFSGAMTVSDMLPGYWAWQHVDMAL